MSKPAPVHGHPKWVFEMQGGRVTVELDERSQAPTLPLVRALLENSLAIANRVICGLPPWHESIKYEGPVES